MTTHTVAISSKHDHKFDQWSHHDEGFLPGGA